MAEPQLVIKAKKTVGWYLGLAIILLLLLVGSHISGRYFAMMEREQVIATADSLQKELDKYQSAYQKASEDLVKQSQFSEVDNLSSQQLTETIKQLQSTQRQLESELKFYRNIMAPELDNKGLTIAELVISKTMVDSKPQFKLVLTQSGRQDQFLKGSVDIKLHGKLNGSDKTYSFSELGRFNVKDFQFQFRYFQNIEGELEIPSGFVADYVIVEAKTRGLRKNQTVRKQVNWAI